MSSSEAERERELKIHRFVEDFFAEPTERRFWWVPIVFFGAGTPILNRQGHIRSWKVERRVPKDFRGLAA